MPDKRFKRQGMLLSEPIIGPRWGGQGSSSGNEQRQGKFSPAQGTLTLETRIAAWPKLVHTVDWLRFFPNLGAVFLPIESSEVWLYLWYFFRVLPNGPQKSWRYVAHSSLMHALSICCEWACWWNLPRTSSVDETLPASGALGHAWT
jgi:hypothetical protein